MRDINEELERSSLHSETTAKVEEPGIESFQSAAVSRMSISALSTSEQVDLSLLDSASQKFIQDNLIDADIQLIAESWNKRSDGGVMDKVILNDEIPACISRSRNGHRSAVAEAVELATVLTELAENHAVSEAVPKFIGFVVRDGEILVATEDQREHADLSPIGGALESEWDKLQENHPEVAEQLKGALAPAVLAEMERKNSIDTVAIGFNELYVSEEGQVEFLFDLSSSRDLCHQLRAGAVLDYKSPVEVSYLRDHKPLPYPSIMIRDVGDMLESYADGGERRFWPDQSQSGRALVQYHERDLSLDEDNTVLTNETHNVVSSVEEALLLGARRQNTEMGRDLKHGSSTIGQELGLTIAVYERGSEQQIAWHCSIGEDTSVNMSEALEHIEREVGGGELVMVHTLHTHQLYRCESPTILHGADLFAGAYSMTGQEQSVERNEDGSPTREADGKVWKKGGGALYEGIVYLAGKQAELPPEAGGKELATREHDRVGSEIGPILLNGDLYKTEYNFKDQLKHEQAVHLIDSLKADSEFAQKVASTILRQVEQQDNPSDSITIEH